MAIDFDPFSFNGQNEAKSRLQAESIFSFHDKLFKSTTAAPITQHQINPIKKNQITNSQSEQEAFLVDRLAGDFGRSTDYEDIVELVIEDSPFVTEEMLDQATNQAVSIAKEMQVPENELQSLTVSINEIDFNFYVGNPKDEKLKIYYVRNILGRGAFGEVSSLTHFEKKTTKVLKQHLSTNEVKKMHKFSEEEYEKILGEAKKKIEAAQKVVDDKENLKGIRTEKEIDMANKSIKLAEEEIKKIEKAKLDYENWMELSVRDLKNEYQILRKIHNEQKSDLWGIQDMHSRLVMISPKAPNAEKSCGFMGKEYAGSYEKYIAFAPFDLEKRLFEFHQILGGLAHLSQKGYVHHDLKLDNFLVRPKSEYGEYMQVHIADFGKAFSIDEINREGFIFQQPFKNYATRKDFTDARTLLRKHDIENFTLQQQKCDMFALGCSLYSVLKGKLPYLGLNWRDTSRPLEPLDESIPEPLQKLIFAMLEPDSAKRLTPEEAFLQFDHYVKDTHPDLHALISKLIKKA